MTPQGWENISPNRQRAATQEAVLTEVRRVYSTAFAFEPENIEGLLAYRMRSDERILAVAWANKRFGWEFVVLPRSAFRIGAGASLIRAAGGNRLRIVPFKAGENPGIRYKIQESSMRRIRPRLAPEKYKVRDHSVYPKNGGWFVELRTARRKHEYGPYPSFYEAYSDLPILTKQVEGNISNTS